MTTSTFNPAARVAINIVSKMIPAQTRPKIHGVPEPAGNTAEVIQMLRDPLREPKDVEPYILESERETMRRDL